MVAWIIHGTSEPSDHAARREAAVGSVHWGLDRMRVKPLLLQAGVRLVRGVSKRWCRLVLEEGSGKGIDDVRPVSTRVRKSLGFRDSSDVST